PRSRSPRRGVSRRGRALARAADGAARARARRRARRGLAAGRLARGGRRAALPPDDGLAREPPRRGPHARRGGGRAERRLRGVGPRTRGPLGARGIGAGEPRLKTAWEREVMWTGIGGQGVQLAATILARAATLEGREVMSLGTYGGTMRGGN